MDVDFPAAANRRAMVSNKRKVIPARANSKTCEQRYIVSPFPVGTTTVRWKWATISVQMIRSGIVDVERTLSLRLLRRTLASPTQRLNVHQPLLLLRRHKVESRYRLPEFGEQARLCRRIVANHRRPAEARAEVFRASARGCGVVGSLENGAAELLERGEARRSDGGHPRCRRVKCLCRYCCRRRRRRRKEGRSRARSFRVASRHPLLCRFPVSRALLHFAHNLAE